MSFINAKRILYGSLVIIWIITTIGFIFSILTPIQTENQIIKNRIEQKLTFNYLADVMPCELYPKGGLITPGQFIFSKITNMIRMNIDALITAESSVSIKGTYQVFIILSADSFWAKEYALTSEVDFETSGVNNKIMLSSFDISPNDFFNIIDTIEGEIGIRPNKYNLKIVPQINGQIISDNNNTPISIDTSIAFDFSRSQITLLKDDSSDKDAPIQGGKKEFIKNIDFTETDKTKNAITTFGIHIPVLAARIIYGIISLCITLFGANLLRKKIITSKASITEVERIRKKYKNQVVKVEYKLDLSNDNNIIFESFESLLNKSDEKNEQIFICNSFEDNVIFCILGGEYNYIYKPKYENKKTSYRRKGNLSF